MQFAFDDKVLRHGDLFLVVEQCHAHCKVRIIRGFHWKLDGFGVWGFEDDLFVMDDAICFDGEQCDPWFSGDNLEVGMCTCSDLGLVGQQA